MKFLFIFVTLFAIVLFYFATNQNKKLAVIYLAWMVIVGFISNTSFLQNTIASPPPFLLVMVPSIIIMFYAYFQIKNIAIDNRFLFAIHTLRVPVEMVLYHLFLQKKIPEIMTFTGSNFDIVMGITATLLLMYLWIRKKHLPTLFVKIWNGIGILFLVNIVVIALLSAPLSIQQFGFDQPNVAILNFPYTYLPTIVVPIVFVAHLLGLLNKKLDSETQV